MRLLPILIVLAGAAHADWTELSDKDFPLEPPPAEGSAATRADLDEILTLQKSRTSEHCELAKAQRVPDLSGLFRGSGVVSDAELERAEPLFARASSRLTSIISVLKSRYRRRRPYEVDARVSPCAAKPSGGTSYPSYHAAAGAMDACLLSRLHPERAKEIAQLGRVVGELRVISGVHHRGDVEAGRSIGTRFCGALLADPGFAAELDALKP